MTLHYRNTTDILAQILQSAAEGEGVTKTYLMYKAFLSFEQLKKYLPILTENGLLDYSNGNEQLYKIAEKGMRFLHMYGEIAKYVSIVPEETQS